MHSTFELLGSEGARLKGKQIVLALTGSIACVKAFELCRTLVRHGADVRVVMSKAACRIIHPEAMQYASGNQVCTEITGNVEHIQFFGENGTAHILVIAPATANTIGKIAWGWDDTPPTTFATTAIGSKKPILVVPAMHISMYKHPIVQENIKKLKKMGIKFIEPKLEEGKAKFPDIDEIVLEIARLLNSQNSKLANKRILVSAGPLREYFDPIRFISTASSGKIGVEIVKSAYAQGANVCVVGQRELFNLPKTIKVLKAENFKELRSNVLKELSSKKYHYYISAAAISDFSVKMQKEKIKSTKKIKLDLIPNKKLVLEIRKKFPKLKIVAFKAETNKTKKELAQIAKDFLVKNKMDLVIACDVAHGTIGRDSAEFIVIKKDANIRTLAGSKSAVAEEIVSLLAEI